MKFSKTELLNKLNATTVSKNRSLRWQYNNEENPTQHGFAQVRFEQGERFLIAEASHWGKEIDAYKFDDYDADNIEKVTRPETFELRASRNWMTDEYEIIALVVDGENYPLNNAGMIELAFSIFLSRADEIETLSKKSKVEATEKPVVHSKQEAMHRKMPSILFGDHYLAFSNECQIQGVA